VIVASSTVVLDATVLPAIYAVFHAGFVNLKIWLI
jgi:hypothetical protein